MVMTPLLPTIGPYRVLEELGRGAMGTVYRAEGEDGDVAIKVLHPQLIQESDHYLARFRREAEMGLDLRHENVVRTFEIDSFQHRGAPHHYLVLEYVEGQDLRELLREIGTIPEELCWHIGREIGKALGAIHQAGAVHRDVKPENIMITPDHEVKLMDLGTAGLMDQAVSQALTGGFLGTALYAAPEQILGEDLDRRADWYALGLVLFELATGRRATKSAGIVELMHERLEVTPPRAGDINPQLSPFLEEVLAGLLTRERAERLDHLPTEDSDWWKERTKTIRAATHQPLRRIRIPRETALYGRENEIEQLTELFTRASAGEGQVVLLEGEAGIGKTRLVDEFVDGLEVDVHFLFGANPPGGAATAAGAYVAAYREQIGDTSSAPYLQEVPALAPPFDALLRGDAAPAGEARLTKEALQTAFIHATRGLAKDRPTVVLIEDLHFAPVEGLALFAALSQALANDRVLLIGTARRSLSQEWVTQLAHLEHVTRIGLERLGAKQVGALLLGALGSKRLAEDLAFQVLTKSDGNPFFVFEILRSLRDERYVTESEDGSWTKQRDIDQIEIPSSVLDLIESRVSDLSEEERELLDVAACAGFEFDPLLVAEALGINRTPALKMLARLERRHRIVRSVGRRFVFDHQQIQQVLYDRVPELLREDHHASLGDALERRAGEAPDGDTRVALAEHFLRGARGEDAARHLEEALLHLSLRYDYERMGALADRALGVPDLLAGAPRVRVLLRLVTAREIAGRLDERRVVLGEAASLAHELNDPVLLAEVTLALGKLAETEGDTERVLELAREARDHAGRASEPRLLARSHTSAGNALHRLGRTKAAISEFEAILEVLGGAPDAVEEARAVTEICRCRLYLGEEGTARAEIEEAIEVFRQAGDRQSEVVAWSVLANAAGEAGDFEESMRCNEQVIAIERTIGHRVNLGVTLGNIAVIHNAQGNLAAAKEGLEEQLELARECGHVGGEGLALMNLGAVLTSLGDAEAARAALGRSVGLLREIKATRALAYALQDFARLARQVGDLEEAQRWAEVALACRRRWPDREAECETLVVLGSILADRGDLQAAAGRLDEALAIGRELGSDEIINPCQIVGARRLGWSADAALEGWQALEGSATPVEEIETLSVLWEISGDEAYLQAAREELARLRERAPPEYRDSMIENVPVYRRVHAGV